MVDATRNVEVVGFPLKIGPPWPVMRRSTRSVVSADLFLAREKWHSSLILNLVLFRHMPPGDILIESSENHR